MMRDLVDAVIAVIFCGSMCFRSVEVYKFFRTEAKKVLEKGGLRTPCPCLDLYQENVLTEY